MRRSVERRFSRQNRGKTVWGGVEIQINYSVFRVLSGKICRTITGKFGWLYAALSWQIRRINCNAGRRMIDDRIIGPYFTTIAATNSYCFIFIGHITNMRVTERKEQPISDKDRRGADRTILLCKPRYQCRGNWLVNISAGNQVALFSQFLVEIRCYMVLRKETVEDLN